MSRRPYDTGRRDSLGRRIKDSGSSLSSPPDAGVGEGVTAAESDDPALADHLAEGKRCVDLAAEFVDRYSYETFMSDEHVQNSGSMLIIRMREVANRLPQSFKDEHSHIPWRAIIAMGNIIAHEYAITADPDMVWSSLLNNFPELDVFDPA